MRKNKFFFNKLFVMLFWLTLSALPALSAVNPIAQFYNGAGGYPSWTNRIKWGNVINMSTYATGKNDFEKFENARDVLYAQGGGVLYYPAGTYDFSDIPGDSESGRGLMLKKGVVILGDAPTSNKSAVDDGTLSLPTKFTFKYITKNVTVNGAAATGQIPRMWNLIGITTGAAGEKLKDVNDVGICWINLDGATIYFGAQFNWGASWGNSNSWLGGKANSSWIKRVPDGTHYMDPFAGQIPNSECVGAGKGRIVFGCQLNNSTPSDNVLDVGAGVSSFHVFRFSGRISVYGSDVFVANNSIPKPAKCFKYDQKINYRKNATPYNVAPKIVVEPILFDYAKTLGIDVNKSLLGFSPLSRKDLNKSAYYLDNVVIIDNWVYSHGNKGYEVSGEWLVMRTSKNVRDFLQDGDNVYGAGTGWRLTMDGYLVSYETDDNLARAIDVGGKSVWVDSCYYYNVGSNPGNDGEGILCQRHNDIEIFSWALTHNWQGAGGDDSYIGGWDVHNIGHLNFKNTVRGFVGEAKTSTFDTLVACAFVDNIAGSVLTDGIEKEPVIVVCPTSSPAAPTNVMVTPDNVNKRIKITWKDNATNEIGYRVDRRVAGSAVWRAIVYRPLQSKVYTSDLGYPNLGNPNLPEWYDYLAPEGVALEYRAVAINCKDDNSGASPWVPGLLPTGINTQDFSFPFYIYPNPASESAVVSFQLVNNSDVKISVYDILGKKVMLGSSENLSAGEHQLNINIARLQNGIYFVKMDVNGEQIIQKLIISKSL
jgi:hypothetical protein